jgi:hypothetical protein
MAKIHSSMDWNYLLSELPLGMVLVLVLVLVLGTRMVKKVPDTLVRSQGGGGGIRLVNMVDIVQ